MPCGKVKALLILCSVHTYMHNHSDGNTLRTLKLSICPLLEVCIYIIRIGSKTSVIYREVCFIWKFRYCRHEAALFPVVRKPTLSVVVVLPSVGSRCQRIPQRELIGCDIRAELNTTHSASPSLSWLRVCGDFG